MIRRPPKSTRTDTIFPYTARFRSIGSKMITAEQRADLLAIAGPLKGAGVLDFVSAWYLKAAAYLISRHSREGGNPVTEATRCAFVPTNSIRSEERRGGTARASKCRHRWSAVEFKQKKDKILIDL